MIVDIEDKLVEMAGEYATAQGVAVEEVIQDILRINLDAEYRNRVMEATTHTEAP